MLGKQAAQGLRKISSWARALGFAGALAASLGLAGLASGCEPVKLPHQQPGPAGCGKRDPRNTAPGMLSIAQKETYRKLGSPDDVRDNDRGGLDWLYRRSSGSVFGEQQTVEVYQFDKDGLLYNQTTDVLRRVGK